MILDPHIRTAYTDQFSNLGYRCHQSGTGVIGVMASCQDTSGHESGDTCHISDSCHARFTTLKLPRATARNKRKNFVPRPVPKISYSSIVYTPDSFTLENPGRSSVPPCSDVIGSEAPLDLSLKKVPADGVLNYAAYRTFECDNVLRNHLKSPLSYNPGKTTGSHPTAGEGHILHCQPRICDNYPLHSKLHPMTPSITDNMGHGDKFNDIHGSRNNMERNMILPELLLAGPRKSIQHNGENQGNYYNRNIQYPISNYHAKKNQKTTSTFLSNGRSETLSYDSRPQNFSVPLSTFRKTEAPTNEVDVKNDILIRRILKDVSSLSNARAEEMRKKQMLLHQSNFKVTSTKFSHGPNINLNGTMDYDRDEAYSSRPSLNHNIQDDPTKLYRDFRWNYVYKCNQSLNCPMSRDSFAGVGVPEHYHCHGDREMCPLPLYNKDDIKEHCKFHEQEDSNLESSFKLYAMTQPCEGSDCPYDRRESHFHCVWAGCSEVFATLEHLARRQHYRMHQQVTWSQMSDDPIHTTANFQATNLFHAGKRKRGRPPKNRILDTPLQNTIAYAFESGSLRPLREDEMSREGVTLDKQPSNLKRGSSDIHEVRFNQGERVPKPYQTNCWKQTPPQYKFGEFDFNLKEIRRNPHADPTTSQNKHPLQTKATVHHVAYDSNLPYYHHKNKGVAKDDLNVATFNINDRRFKVGNREQQRPDKTFSHLPPQSSNNFTAKSQVPPPAPPVKLRRDLASCQETGPIYSEFIVSTETSFIQTGVYNPAMTTKGSTSLHKPDQPQQPSSSHSSQGQVASTNRVTYNMEKMAARRKNSKNQAYKNLCITFMPYKRAPKTRKKVNPDAS